MPTKLDITLKRGDSLLEPLALTDEAGNVIDLTNALAVLSMKIDADDPDTAAPVLLSSRASTEIEFTDIPNGKLSFKFQSHHTADLDPGCYPYDLELLRRDVEKTAAEVGTVAVTAGSATIVGTGTAFMLLNKGDLIQTGSVLVPNAFPVRVVKVIDDTHVVTDWTAWTNEAALTLRAWIAKVNTVVYGKISLTSDVTR